MYSRFKSIQGFGDGELQKLEDSTAAVVGLGATGSVIAEHLARHGVNLIVIDRDYLEEKDLNTSNIYSRKQVENSIPKARAVEETLSHFTEVDSHVESLDSSNVEILDDADIVMDGTDNLETRFLLNEYSKREGAPWIYTAAIAEQGYSMFFQKKCFSCVFDEVPAGSLETCETAGIMREISTVAASISAWKAVRYLCGKEGDERFDIFPGDSLEVESIGCKVCEEGVYEHLESSGSATSVCGESKYQIEGDVSESAFEKLRDAGEILAENDYLTRAIVDGEEFVLFRSGRAIIEARDRGQAEARFDRIIGR